MSWLIVISLIVFSLILVFITKLVFLKFLNGSSENENLALIKKTEDSLKELKDSFKNIDELASKLFNLMKLKAR